MSTPLLQARALLLKAERSTMNSLEAGELQSRLTHCELAVRYLRRALALLASGAPRTPILPPEPAE